MVEIEDSFVKRVNNKQPNFEIKWKPPDWNGLKQWKWNKKHRLDIFSGFFMEPVSKA